MSELNLKELDLLQRIKAKPELQVLFFRKVKGTKWFNALSQAGYFDVEHLPKPQPAQQEGYVTIPHWEVVGYLLRTASELTDNDFDIYAPRILEIISKSTNYAKQQGFGNNRVWWQFSEIVAFIPSKYITVEFIDVIDYWLCDKFDRGLVAVEIGEKWLAQLLNEESKHSLELAINLLDVLYKVEFIEQSDDDRSWQKAHLRFDDYHAGEITKKNSHLSGEKLGERAVSVFHNNLVKILLAIGNDTWSAIWQPAIPKHEQNKHHHEPENLLVDAYRESLEGFIAGSPSEASEYIIKLLESTHQTIQRIAIYCIGQNFKLFKGTTAFLLDEKYLRNSNFRYEIWHFYNRNYKEFEQDERDSYLSLITSLSELDENGEPLTARTAYEQARWFSSIKDCGKREMVLYEDAISIAKAEPEHPDFSSYMTTSWGESKSPYTIDELGALSTKDLVNTLKDYKGGKSWQEPGVEGLVKTFKQLIKSSPSRYYIELPSFLNLDIAYVHEVISAYNELWNEKEKLPWDEVWDYLLDFCSVVIRGEEFWNEENIQPREAFIANRNWIVAAIGRLLEAGAKNDGHAFDEKYHRKVESLITFLLENQKGTEFDLSGDAVSRAINSPRGQCIEALINLTLRECRLSDQKNNKDHSKVWKRFQHYYDTELSRSKDKDFEFETLVTRYLSNFLYMSKDWVLSNLPNIFDQSDYLRWLCAMQGYSCVGIVYQEIYIYLAEHGDLLKAITDESIKKQVDDRFIQQVAVAYINDFESLEDENGLLLTLINRKKPEELRQLIWFLWSLRKTGDTKLKDKVYDLWTLLVDLIDFSSKKGKKLASELCQWSAFVSNLDSERKDILLKIAPFADESYNSNYLLESLANLSAEQPSEANEIWLKILERSAPDFPEEEIRKILFNLVAQGDEGKRLARLTVSEYLKKGVERPSIWLKEIMRDNS